MRIAIAGSGGLASSIAFYIQQETPHQVLILSRNVRQLSIPRLPSSWTKSRQNQPNYQARDVAVQVVDYDNENSLGFALSGIDIVVSTVTGTPQLNLIRAAVRARVRRFIPAEFEGRPELRPANDPLDGQRYLARQLLYQYQNYIQSTVITCGIFYERFQPGGLAAAGIGFTSRCSGEGAYMLDIRNMTAEVPVYSPNNQNTEICMTSVHDVARFVVRALELEQWPSELRVYGERMTVLDLATLVSRLKGKWRGQVRFIKAENSAGEEFDPITWYISQDMLRAELSLAMNSRDAARAQQVRTLIATAQGRYVFGSPNLRSLFPQIQPMRFRDWIMRVWNIQN